MTSIMQPLLPPLTDEEVSLAGVELALRMAMPDAGDPSLDTRPEVEAMWKLLRSARALIRLFGDNDPVMPDDTLRDGTVLAAREVIRDLVNASTAWLRMLNALIPEPPRE
jgi:hypothetical protein